jgi:hypothetical protein
MLCTLYFPIFLPSTLSQVEYVTKSVTGIFTLGGELPAKALKLAASWNAGTQGTAQSALDLQLNHLENLTPVASDC